MTKNGQNKKKKVSTQIINKQSKYEEHQNTKKKKNRQREKKKKFKKFLAPIDYIFILHFGGFVFFSSACFVLISLIFR